MIRLDFKPAACSTTRWRFSPAARSTAASSFARSRRRSGIVFVNSFSDAEGGITRAPFPQLEGKWPLEVLNTMTLTEQGGMTTLNLRGGPINATEEERKMFASMHESMRQGFGGTFDQLADYLAKG